MTPHEELLEHPQPVNKTAALHIAGGDRTGRDEMLWAQREAFERAMTDARLRNMEREQENRLELARAGGRLDTLKPGSFYRKDWNKHVHKLRSRVGINIKLDTQIQKRIAERLAPEPIVERQESPTLFQKRLNSADPEASTGVMRRRNAKRYAGALR